MTSPPIKKTNSYDEGRVAHLKSASFERSPVAIRAYQNTKNKEVSYEDINTFLRNNSIRDTVYSVTKVKNSGSHYNRILGNIILKIDARMDNGEGDEFYYRGVDGDVLDSFIEKGVLVNKAYTSVTTRYDVAQRFASGFGDTDQPPVLRIRVPKIIRRCRIPSFETNALDNESETLIERNTQLVSDGPIKLKKLRGRPYVTYYDCLLEKVG